MGLFERFQSHFAIFGTEILQGSAAKQALVGGHLAINGSVVTIGSLLSLSNPEIGPSDRLSTSQKPIAVSHFPAPWYRAAKNRVAAHTSLCNSSTY